MGTRLAPNDFLRNPLGFLKTNLGGGWGRERGKSRGGMGEKLHGVINKPGVNKSKGARRAGKEWGEVAEGD